MLSFKLHFRVMINLKKKVYKINDVKQYYYFFINLTITIYTKLAKPSTYIPVSESVIFLHRFCRGPCKTCDMKLKRLG